MNVIYSPVFSLFKQVMQRKLMKKNQTWMEISLETSEYSIHKNRSKKIYRVTDMVHLFSLRDTFSTALSMVQMASEYHLFKLRHLKVFLNVVSSLQDTFKPSYVRKPEFRNMRRAQET